MFDFGQILLGGISAGLGTWFGAWAAFKHEQCDQRQRAHQREGETLRRTMFILLEQRTLLSNTWDQAFRPMASDSLRHITVRPFYGSRMGLRVPIAKLHFLLRTEYANLLHQLYIGHRRVETILAGIKQRNRIHREAQNALAERAQGDGGTPGEIRRLIGPHRWKQLKGLTDDLYTGIPCALKEIDRNCRAVEAVAKAHYANVTMFTVLERSAECGDTS